MKNLLLTSVSLAALVGTAIAADANITVDARRDVVPVGVGPVIGFISGTIISTSTVTVDAPSGGIVGWMAEVRDVGGDEKAPNVTLSGSTFTIASSNATSGTIAVSDTVRILIIHQP